MTHGVVEPGALERRPGAPGPESLFDAVATGPCR